MSEEKLNITDLVPALAERTGMSKAQAEAFLKALFAQIEAGLRHDHSVKFHHFGTFKLQWNGPRKSVDVNTGEEIVIEGYNKVVLVPDAEVRERINAPFAFLEPVELDEAPLDAELPKPAMSPTEEAVGQNLKALEEEADAIKTLLNEINGEDCFDRQPLPVEQEEDEDEELPEEFEDEPVKPENTACEPTEEVLTGGRAFAEQETAQAGEATDCGTEKATAEADTPQRHEMPERVEVAGTVDPTGTGDAVEAAEQPKPSGKNKTWKIMGGIAVGFCLILVAVYFYMVHRVENWAESRIAQTHTEHPCEEAAANTEVATPLPQPSTEATALPVQPKQAVSVFDEPRVYTEFIATVELTKGSRLAWLSRKYYGSPYFWVYIYEANRAAIANPNHIPIGTKLRIPRLPEALADPENEACIEYALALRDRYMTKQ